LQYIYFTISVFLGLPSILSNRKPLINEALLGVLEKITSANSDSENAFDIILYSIYE